ncbi:hypothetical protein PENANT_c004G07611 [Penicillium antarcticum]|uniref:Uncharacterized protein n=1 Tax=Penicillium antarcticum TaxID=416450 RepID=A0A1V6QG04_9EURO|nr:uncharacterized protein N7508_002532 [Penicillium antarcticum]KAJ5318024.1 hypothetical protein N7508_002532 [Penicillium antarcticum]OQD88150.1 hypothetical protein PENANT_c004G07611 [Penicillium antarcticum]
MSDDDKSRSKREYPGDESNPFVAFRRYADEQVSTMLQSITGLPSMVTPPHNNRWEIFADDHGYESRTSRQRTGDNSGEKGNSTDRDGGNGYSGGDDNSRNPDNTSHPRSRWSENEDPWHSQSWRKWCNGPSDFFGFDSFFDRFWLEDRVFPFASHLLNPNRSFFLPDMFEDTNSPTWPIAYIMFSPYSPLHLERQAQYRTYRENGVFSSIMSSLSLNSDHDPLEPQWRDAFEDLLRLENGKSMLNRDAPAKSETGNNWLQGLVKRGSLGDRWKYVPGTEGHPWSGITFSGCTEQDRSLSEKEDKPADRKNEQEAKSELDLYERFLHDMENRERESFRGASESPLLRMLLEERRQQQEELEKYRRGVPKVNDEHISDENESWLELVSGGSQKSVPETSSNSSIETQTVIESKTMNEKVETASEPAQSRIISSMTRTERIRLPDGSVESKIVKTKRFADGREETDSTVEVSHSQPGDSKSDESSQSKNGWFWKD